MSSTKHKLFVEIRTEELPPGLLNSLVVNFAQELHAGLVKVNLVSSDDKFTYYVTPRRLIAIIDNVSREITGEDEIKRGPSIKNAYGSDQQPTKALLGFLKSNNAEIKDVQTIDYRDEKYVAIQKSATTISLQERIGLLIEKIISKTSAPRLMRWGANEFRFVRPIKGIYIVHDECIITKVFNQDTNDHTIGHRFLSPTKFSVTNIDEIEIIYKEHKIILDSNTRKAIIEEQANLLQENISLDPDLLNDVVAMCEYPSLHICTFDEQYLSLPQKVVIVCIKKHLKAFPALVKDKLLAKFIFVADNEFIDNSILIAGLSRVIKARLDDALFIFAIDKKLTEEEMLNKLKGINYVHGFGSIYDRSLRLETITSLIANHFNLDANEVAEVKLASKLSKVDLCTELVNEYPDLEGHIASILLNKQNKSVRELIDGHLNRDLDNSENKLRDVLVLSAEFERLVVMATNKKLPKGSGDPFGLRRSISRVIKIAYRNPEIDINNLLAEVIAVCTVEGKANNDINKDIKLQFIYRLNQNITELLNLKVVFHKKVLNAILDPLLNNCTNDSALFIRDEINKLIALNNFINDNPKELENLLLIAKRLDNISTMNEEVDTKLFELDEEHNLFNEYQKVKAKVDEFINANEHQKALTNILELTPSINVYFDKVMVNVDDKKISNNRKSLLGAVNSLINCIANTKKLYS